MTQKPRAVVADIHFHKWSAFSSLTDENVNTRLIIQVDELIRVARELASRGGDTMIIAGDVMHVRGSIDPEVWNYIFSAFVLITGLGVHVYIIPGNHDLVGRETTKIGNAVQTLEAIEGVTVVTEPARFTQSDGSMFVMIPWISDKAALREAVTQFDDTPEADLFIHAGIDGVLPGMPDHGLSAADVASWGFKRVFAGDYHNHKIMEDGKVISIGALTHNTWSDLGSKAGFLLVTDDKIEYRASRAPAFVEITGDTPEEEIPMIVDGNYVRIRGMKMNDLAIKDMREELMRMGAKGVTFQVVKEDVLARTGTTTVKTATLDESVDQFINKMENVDVAAVKKGAADVLSSVRAADA